jgi:selenocysteine lyase/cysteine desulfurase
MTHRPDAASSTNQVRAAATRGSHMKDMAPLACQRSAFALPDGVHYLNCAYMGPLPAAAQEAGIAGVRRKALPTIPAADFFRESDEARVLLARVIGAAEAQRVAILPAVSYGIAIAARNLPCARGQNIVVAAEQFPSNVYAWRRLARERGAQLRTVAAPVAAAPRAAAWSEAISDAIDGATCIVALPHVNWTDGTRFDLDQIGERVRRHGAAFVIDGSQSIGALDLPLARIQPDAVLCAGYKWLLGPYGLSFGWFGPRFDDGVPLEETWIGRQGSEDFQRLVDYRDEYQPGALRYDVGEHSNFILLPMALASMRLVLDWGAARIQQYCDTLFGAVLAEAESLGFSIEPREGRGAHLFGLRVPRGVELRALHTALQERSVFASLRGSALRVSPNVYNDRNDADALLAALRAAATATAGTSATRL